MKLCDFILKDVIHLYKSPCISVASHDMFKMAAMTGRWGNFIFWEQVSTQVQKIIPV